MLYYIDYFESVIMYFKRPSSTSSSNSNEKCTTGFPSSILFCLMLPFMILQSHIKMCIVKKINDYYFPLAIMTKYY